MKTVKTLAGEIGVTKQAVFQKMKKEPLASGLNDLMTRIDGKVYICPEGEGLIKGEFNKTSKRHNPVIEDTLYEILEILQEQMAKKDRQLDALNLHISIKNKKIEDLIGQIDELTTALATAQEMAKTAQALHAGDIHRELIEKLLQNQKEEKKGFWKKASEPK